MHSTHLVYQRCTPYVTPSCQVTMWLHGVYIVRSWSDLDKLTLTGDKQVVYAAGQSQAACSCGNKASGIVQKQFPCIQQIFPMLIRKKDIIIYHVIVDPSQYALYSQMLVVDYPRRSQIAYALHTRTSLK